MALATRRPRRRWSDDNHHFGPLTYAHSKWSPFEVMLCSGDEEDPWCHLRAQALGHVLILELPAVVKPWRGTHTFRHQGETRSYERVEERRFGLMISEGHISVYYGVSPHDGDSKLEKRWGHFFGFTQWRHVRTTLYDAKGKLFSDANWGGRDSRMTYKAYKAVENACPSVVFDFDDFDGERIRATTRIEEREWLFGEGWFRWLSLFRRPKIRRSLDLDFSKEVGREKGSWKGGTTGHSIDMLPGELHEAAFRRYCEKEHRSKSGTFRLTFVGEVTP